MPKLRPRIIKGSVHRRPQVTAPKLQEPAKPGKSAIEALADTLADGIARAVDDALTQAIPFATGGLVGENAGESMLTPGAFQRIIDAARNARGAADHVVTVSGRPASFEEVRRIMRDMRG
jgi:hypothetical protein